MNQRRRDKIAVAHQHPQRRFSIIETARLVRNVLSGERRSHLAVSVVFVSSRFIRSLNKKFLRHDSVTDVISFPLRGRDKGFDGEVYVNLDRAKTQAKDYGVNVRDEVRRLVIHGALHLVGYEDKTAKGRAAMRLKEERYLSQKT